MISLLCTQAPSSVIAMTPAFLSWPVGASCSPFIPTVRQPVGYTWTTASRSTLSMMRWMVPALSQTGLVFGMHTTVVKPPAAAASVPLRISSLCVWPGSRKWTWISTRPGATTRPVASTTVASASCALLILSTIFPSTAKMSPTASR